MTNDETELQAGLDDRDDQALALRECGCTYATIAKELGLETATLARKAYLRALKHRSLEEQEILRRLELDRFETLAASRLLDDAREGPPVPTPPHSEVTPQSSYPRPLQMRPRTRYHSRWRAGP